VMTIHKSKGLEYPVVFVSGMIQGSFPNYYSVTEGDGGIEEERRLMYVAITRAEKAVYMTGNCGEKMVGNRPVRNRPSKFLLEVPKACWTSFKHYKPLTYMHPSYAGYGRCANYRY